MESSRPYRRINKPSEDFIYQHYFSSRIIRCDGKHNDARRGESQSAHRGDDDGEQLAVPDLRELLLQMRRSGYSLRRRGRVTPAFNMGVISLLLLIGTVWLIIRERGDGRGRV